MNRKQREYMAKRVEEILKEKEKSVYLQWKENNPEPEEVRENDLEGIWHFLHERCTPEPGDKFELLPREESEGRLSHYSRGDIKNFFKRVVPGERKEWEEEQQKEFQRVKREIEEKKTQFLDVVMLKDIKDTGKFLKEVERWIP